MCVHDWRLPEEPIAWREMVTNYSARVIQKQWRIHRNWQEVLKEQWRVQLRYKHADDHVGSLHALYTKINSIEKQQSTAHHHFIMLL